MLGKEKPKEVFEGFQRKSYLVKNVSSNTEGAKGGAFDSVIRRIRSGQCTFRDLVPLFASRGFPVASYYIKMIFDQLKKEL